MELQDKKGSYQESMQWQYNGKNFGPEAEIKNAPSGNVSWEL